jgi:hypothetical protein
MQVGDAYLYWGKGERKKYPCIILDPDHGYYYDSYHYRKIAWQDPYDDEDDGWYIGHGHQDNRWTRLEGDEARKLKADFAAAQLRGEVRDE